MAGDYISVFQDEDLPVIVVVTDYGLTVRYEIDMSFFFLACSTCYSRLASIMGQENPYCSKCRKDYPEYYGEVLVHLRHSAIRPTLESWSKNLLPIFEIPIAVSPLSKILKKIAKEASREDEVITVLTGEEIQEICKRYSGPVAF